MAIYGVHIKSDNCSEEDIHVYTDKDAAFKVLKSHKEARLKVFKTHAEAQKFCEFGFDATSINISGLKSPSSSPSAEKVPYRTPKSQELVLFRKSIENGSLETVKTTIWDNPRYLIGSGDTPSILKEGTRYNAIHVAALHNKAKVCELILETIRKPEFVQLLHGKKNYRTCQDVSNILLEMYLNTPEKGRSDTPLHLAVKYGAIEVVEILTSYLQCKMTYNLDGLLPKDVVCSRAKDQSALLYESISSLLKERFYVPVIRSTDSTIPPIIGEPFTPQNPPILKQDPLSPEMEIQAYAGPMDKEHAKIFRKRWKTPPRLVNNLNLSTSLSSSIGSSSQQHQFISPIKLQQNNKNSPLIKQQLSSTPISKNLFPNKSINFPFSKVQKNLNGDLLEARFDSFNLNDENENGNKHDNLIKPDNEKSDNNIVNISSSDKNLNSIIDDSNEIFMNYRERILSSTSTIYDSNNYLNGDDENNSTLLNNSISFNDNSDVIFDSPSFKERHLKITDPEKGLEIIGRGLAREHNVGWKEYWNFLGSFVNFNTLDGIQQLENYLIKKTKKNIETPIKYPIEIRNKNKKNENVLNYLCTTFKDLSVADDSLLAKNGKLQFTKSLQKKNEQDLNNENNHITSQQQQPVKAYLCVEKSCQIFAQRIYKTIIKNIDNFLLIIDRIYLELNRLRSLVFSYKNDIRFTEVNFNFAHSRFSNLIIAYLKTECNLENDFKKKIKNCFQQIIEFAMDNETTTSIDNKNSTSDIICLSKFLIENLENIDKIISPETLQTEKDCNDLWKTERKCLCDWDIFITSQKGKTLKNRIRHDSTRRRQFMCVNNSNQNIFLMEIDQPQQQQQQQQLKTTDLWSFRNNNHDDEDEDNENDDLFWSGSEDDVDEYTSSADDIYYTPPESPTELNLNKNLLTNEENLSKYTNYILGDEPTKTDVNVLNAIHTLEIDQTLFPCVYQWRLAIMKFSMEDRESFPSPSIVVKSHINLCSTKTSSPSVVRKLFLSTSTGGVGGADI